MARRNICLFIIGLLVVVMPFTALSAGEAGSGQHGLLTLAGEDVVVSEPIQGTAFLMGNNVTVTSSIEGDLFVFAAIANIKGTVTGNLYAFANDLTISGTVERDTFVFGNSVVAETASNLGRDVCLAAFNTSLRGLVGRNGYLLASNVGINAQLEGDLLATTQSLTIGESAIIKGNLNYSAAEKAVIPESAQIGSVEFSMTDQEEQSKMIMYHNLRSLGSALVNTLVIWLFLLLCAPMFTKRAAEHLIGHPIRTSATGLVTVLCLPIIAMTAVLTVVGMGIGFLLIMLYLAGLYLTFAVTAISVGTSIAEHTGVAGALPANLRNGIFVAISAIVLRLLVIIPFTSVITSIAYVVIGCGLLMGFAFKEKPVTLAP